MEGNEATITLELAPFDLTGRAQVDALDAVFDLFDSQVERWLEEQGQRDLMEIFVHAVEYVDGLTGTPPMLQVVVPLGNFDVAEHAGIAFQLYQRVFEERRQDLVALLAEHGLALAPG